ncbi:hypothetical protein PROVRETT_09462 [Providencia rettgeri DSM 1131]|nr:hypothetical protein PROVRETT_09462 [Providencia rettgeri DSM 1131]
MRDNIDNKKTLFYYLNIRMTYFIAANNIEKIMQPKINHVELFENG